jgi:hypothetical protein
VARVAAVAIAVQADQRERRDRADGPRHCLDLILDRRAPLNRLAVKLRAPSSRFSSRPG